MAARTDHLLTVPFINPSALLGADLRAPADPDGPEITAMG
jgi:hypothetical protein